MKTFVKLIFAFLLFGAGMMVNVYAQSQNVASALTKLKTIDDLQSYTGNSPVVFVSDQARGGLFYYDESNKTSDGGTIFTASRPSGGTWVRSFNLFDGVSACWFGVKPDYNYDTKEGTDNSAALQLAINYAAANGLTVYLPTGPYLFLENVNLKANVTLKGEFSSNESFKRQNHAAWFKGSVLVLRGASFTVRANSTVDGFTVYYDQQHYKFEDGSVVKYAPTFLIGELGPKVQNILYIGGSVIVSQTNEPSSDPEKFAIRNIYGMPFEIGIELKYVTDIGLLDNINFNANAIKGLTRGDVSDNDLQTYLAQTVVAFKFGRIDDFNATNIFAFGVRDFFWFTKSDHPLDNGMSYGGTISNGSVDICNTAFRIDRSNCLFGLKISNIFATPLVKGPKFQGDNIPQEQDGFSSFIKIDGDNSVVLLNNVVTFGSSSKAVNGVNKVDYVYYINPRSKNNTIIANNAVNRDYGSLTNPGYSSNNNKISQTVLKQL